MTEPLILASGSAVRADLLTRAGVPLKVVPARIDEMALKAALLAEEAGPRDLADALAEAKARRVAAKHPDRWVLGCDQVLAHRGTLLSKPDTPAQAEDQLARLSDDRHNLLSAAVIYEAGRPVWRHVSDVRLTMRPLSQAFIADYVSRNWDSIRHSVGGYKIEEEGVRLMSRIEGDYFAILGLPLIEVLSFLSLRGKLPT